MSALGPLSRGTVHAVIDMQRMFAEGAWRVPRLPEIAPAIAALAAAKRERTLFTRFVVPVASGEAKGRWQAFYRHWSAFTGERLPSAMLDLVPDLAALASADRIFDKPTYSAFEAPAFAERLAALGADTLVLSGVETDACVLATLLGAVDRGLHVVLLADGLASASQDAHAAVLAHLLPRLSQQVEIASAAEVLAAWKEG